MLAWLGRLLTPADPPRPRLESRVTTLENLVDDLDSRLEYLSSELKKVRGRQFALEKRDQDGTEPTIDAEPAVDQPRPTPPTAHLARRFRGF